MKFKYLATVASASIMTLGLAGIPNNFNSVNAYPCATAQVDPCAA